MLREIKKVFSADFKNDVRYVDFKNSMRQYVKLKNESESIDAKVERMKKEGYVSNCHIEVGEF